MAAPSSRWTNSSLILGSLSYIRATDRPKNAVKPDEKGVSTDAILIRGSGQKAFSQNVQQGPNDSASERVSHTAARVIEHVPVQVVKKSSPPKLLQIHNQIQPTSPKGKARLKVFQLYSSMNFASKKNLESKIKPLKGLIKQMRCDGFKMEEALERVHLNFLSYFDSNSKEGDEMRAFRLVYGMKLGLFYLFRVVLNESSLKDRSFFDELFPKDIFPLNREFIE